MGDLDAVSGLVDRTVEQWGRVDIVVNNAANALTLPLGELTPEAWAKSLDTNLRAQTGLNGNQGGNFGDLAYRLEIPAGSESVTTMWDSRRLIWKAVPRARG